MFIFGNLFPRLRPLRQPRFFPGAHGIAPLRFAAAIFAGLLLRPRCAITSLMTEFFIPLNLSEPLANRKKNHSQRFAYWCHSESNKKLKEKT